MVKKLSLMDKIFKFIEALITKEFRVFCFYCA